MPFSHKGSTLKTYTHTGNIIQESADCIYISRNTHVTTVFRGHEFERVKGQYVKECEGSFNNYPFGMMV